MKGTTVLWFKGSCDKNTHYFSSVNHSFLFRKRCRVIDYSKVVACDHDKQDGSETCFFDVMVSCRLLQDEKEYTNGMKFNGREISTCTEMSC